MPTVEVGAPQPLNRARRRTEWRDIVNGPAQRRGPWVTRSAQRTGVLPANARPSEATEGSRPQQRPVGQPLLLRSIKYRVRDLSYLGISVFSADNIDGVADDWVSERDPCERGDRIAANDRVTVLDESDELWNGNTRS